MTWEVSVVILGLAACASALVAWRWALDVERERRREASSLDVARLVALELELPKLAERVRVLEWRSSKP